MPRGVLDHSFTLNCPALGLGIIIRMACELLWLFSESEVRQWRLSWVCETERLRTQLIVRRRGQIDDVAPLTRAAFTTLNVAAPSAPLRLPDIQPLVGPVDDLPDPAGKGRSA